MKIIVTSVVSEEVSLPVAIATSRLEALLSPIFNGEYYGAGISQLTIFIISVDSDAEKNIRWCKSRNKISRFKNYISNEVEIDISLAVPISPNIVITKSADELFFMMLQILLNKSKNIDIKYPKTFNSGDFLGELSGRLAEIIGSLSAKDGFSISGV